MRFLFLQSIVAVDHKDAVGNPVNQYESMPPIMCDYPTGPQVYNINEYRFKSLLEMGLRSKNQGKFTQWGVPDVRRFCDKMLCSAEGPNRLQEVAGTTKTFSDGTIIGDGRTLCVGFVLQQRCENQEKLQRGDGEGALTLQCFLSKARDVSAAHSSVAVDFLEFDLVEGLTILRHQLANKYEKECENFKLSTGGCDYSAVHANDLKMKQTDYIQQGAHIKCEDAHTTSKKILDLQTKTGVPASYPKWMKPTIACTGLDEHQMEDMHVTLKARQLRIQLLRNWFMKIENDIFRGDRKWLKKTLERYHGASQSTESVIHSSKHETEIDPNVKATYSWKTPDKLTTVQEVRKDAINEEIEDSKKSINLVQEVMEMNHEFLDMTFRSKEITAWEFDIALRFTTKMHGGKNSNWQLMYSYVQPQEVNPNLLTDLETNLLLQPTKVGHTHFLNYLFRPDLWEEKFWHLITPANFNRLFSLRTMTQAICEKVRISKSDFRAPTNIMDGGVDNLILHDSMEYESQVGVCSISAISARVAITRQAYVEETTEMDEKIEANRPQIDEEEVKKLEEEIADPHEKKTDEKDETDELTAEVVDQIENDTSINHLDEAVGDGNQDEKEEEEEEEPIENDNASNASLIQKKRGEKKNTP